MEKNKVFCIGLSRTGTTSICQALGILGYKTIHFPLQLFTHPEIISDELSFVSQRKLNFYWDWRRRKELKALDLKFNENILNNYEAFGDLPIPLFFEELDKKFPGSKFVYTFREEEKWLKSMKWLYQKGSALWNHGLLNDEINLAMYGTWRYDKNKLLKSFQEHHQLVMKYFSDRQDDLLVINIDKENIAFETLCSFLEAELPENKTYPRANTSKIISKRTLANYYLKRNLPFYGIVKSRLTP